MKIPLCSVHFLVLWLIATDIQARKKKIITLHGTGGLFEIPAYLRTSKPKQTTIEWRIQVANRSQILIEAVDFHMPPHNIHGQCNDAYIQVFDRSATIGISITSRLCGRSFQPVVVSSHLATVVFAQRSLLTITPELKFTFTAFTLDPNCPQFECKISKKCIDPALKCNHLPNCGEFDDEFDESDEDCPGQFDFLTDYWNFILAGFLLIFFKVTAILYFCCRRRSQRRPRNQRSQANQQRERNYDDPLPPIPGEPVLVVPTPNKGYVPPPPYDIRPKEMQKDINTPPPPYPGSPAHFAPINAHHASSAPMICQNDSPRLHHGRQTNSSFHRIHFRRNDNHRVYSDGDDTESMFSGSDTGSAVIGWNMRSHNQCRRHHRRHHRHQHRSPRHAVHDMVHENLKPCRSHRLVNRCRQEERKSKSQDFLNQWPNYEFPKQHSPMHATGYMSECDHTRRRFHTHISREPRGYRSETDDGNFASRRHHVHRQMPFAQRAFAKLANQRTFETIL